MIEFKIIAPGADEIQIVNILPASFRGFKLPDAESISAKAHFGEMVFQHYVGKGFVIWYSNYFINHNTELIGRGDIPVLELHIQFLNQFDTIWDGVGSHTLRPYRYNLSYTPYLNNKATFKGGREYHTFDIHFTVEYLQEFAHASPALSKFLDKVANKKAATLSDADHFLTPPMIATVNKLLRLDFNDPLNRFEIEYRVLGLFTKMLRNIEKDPLPPFKLTPYEMERLDEAKAMIEEDLEDKLTIAELAGKVALNQSKLKNGFKFLHGSPVITYRRMLKMERAKELLLQKPNESIDQIAFICGFADEFSFSKSFKKHFLFTPAEFKKYHLK